MATKTPTFTAPIGMSTKTGTKIVSPSGTIGMSGNLTTKTTAPSLPSSPSYSAGMSTTKSPTGQIFYTSNGATPIGYSSSTGRVSSSSNAYTAPVTQSPTSYSSGSTTVKTYTPVSTTFSGADLTNSTAGSGTPSVNLPSAPSSAYNPATVTAGNIATGLNPDGSQKITATTGEQVKTPVEKTAQQAYDEYIKSIQAPADMAESYNKAIEQTGLIKAQTEKNNISNALNAETTKMNLDLQSLRGVGAKEGVTEAVYGQQSAEVTREAMTRILPLQAQLAMANDNVQLAQQQTDTLFKIYAQDAQSKIDYKNKLVQANYDFFTAEEKKKLDKQAKIDDFNMKLYADRISSFNDAANKALAEGNTALYRSLTSTPPPQWTGQADFGQKLDAWTNTMASNAAKYGGATGTVKAPTIQKINGVDMQWNPQTGKWEAPTGTTGSGTSVQSMAQAKANIDNITSLTKGGASAVGPSFLTRAPSGFWGTVGKVASVVGIPSLAGDLYNKLTGKQQEFISSTEQLRSQLSLDSLIDAKSKGATFGALSDTEMKILSSSASKLGTWAINDGKGNIVGYNTTEANFRKEMDKINNFAKLDYVLKGGTPDDVGVKQMPDGSYATQNSDGTYTIIGK